MGEAVRISEIGRVEAALLVISGMTPDELGQLCGLVAMKAESRGARQASQLGREVAVLAQHSTEVNDNG
jgi:hypothetical protein